MLMGVFMQKRKVLVVLGCRRKKKLIRLMVAIDKEGARAGISLSARLFDG